MHHVESSIKVNFTKDYSRFRMILGNRQLNAAKIKRIERDISEGLDVLRYCPILVKENNAGCLDIIDGQHRFWVSKKKKTSVWYILCENLSLMDIARINSNTEKWKDDDFINCYTQQGNDDYKKLQAFKDTYGFPLTTCLSMLRIGTVKAEGSGTGTKETFRQGNFKIMQYSEAVECAEMITSFNAFPYYKTGAFVEAICRVKNAGKIKIAALHEKFMRDPKQLRKCNNGKEYLMELEILFNQGVKVRKTIY